MERIDTGSKLQYLKLGSFAGEAEDGIQKTEYRNQKSAESKEKAVEWADYASSGGPTSGMDSFATSLPTRSERMVTR
jgi:hypothetical protein